MPALRRIPVAALLLVTVASCRSISTAGTPQNRAVREYDSDFGDVISETAAQLRDQGQEVFRRESFGDEAFWGGQLRLHEAIAGEKRGGVGPGMTARQALALGLKVDVDQLPKILAAAIRGGSVSLDEEKTTIELL